MVSQSRKTANLPSLFPTKMKRDANAIERPFAFQNIVGPDTVHAREYVNCDGTDETVQFQRFITAMANKRGVMPSGEVRISAPIVLNPAVNFHLDGIGNDPNGTQTSRIRNTNTGGLNALILDDTLNAGADNFRKISKLGVFGNQLSGNGIVLESAIKVYLDELWVSGHGLDGIYGFKSFSTKLDRVFSVANGRWGVHFVRQANNVSLTRCVINGNSRSSGYGNIFFDASAGLENLGVLIQDCDFTAAGKNAFGGGGDVASAINLQLAHTMSVTVQNCYSEQVATPASGRLFYAGPTVRGLTLLNNYWQDGQLSLDGTREVFMRNNTFNQVTGGVSTVCRVVNSLNDEHDATNNIYIGGATLNATGSLVPYNGWGSAAPVAGTWRRGDRVKFNAPVAGGIEGWICTTAGTPGTWKTFGVISA